VPHPDPLQPDSSAREQPDMAVAAVVAPFSTGRFYAAEFRRRGWPSVAVTPPFHSRPPMDRVHYADFLHVIEHDGDVERTVAQLSQWDVQAVIAGSESGVQIAEDIAEILGLAGNPVATRAARHDRGAMTEALAAAGLPTLRTLRTDSLNEATRWAADLGQRTYMLGPADTSASMRLCEDEAELTHAWGRLRNSRPAFGATAPGPLVLQEEPIGFAYTVNAVSYDGHHRATEVWAQHRIQRSEVSLCDRADLLSLRTPHAKLLAEYTSAALTAVGVRYGATHSTVVLTSQGPVLMDLATRPDGNVDPQAMVSATGSYHARDAVTTLLDPLWLLDDQLSPELKMCRLTLVADHNGYLDAEVLEEMVSLPTVAGTVGNLLPGARVSTTRNARTSPGTLILVSDDRGEIERDAERLRVLERDRLYRWQLFA
jgi:biotin carboxylase